MEATHYAFVDILKGIAILLIVYGHITPGAVPFVTDWVSTFHIPLFFFVSGLLFNNIKYKDNLFRFFKNRAKGLVFPFFVFSIIVAIGYYYVVEDYSSFLISLITTGWGGYALWFIPVLIMVEIAFYPLSKMRPTLVLACILICTILSFISSIKIGLVSNNMLLAFCGIWFYGIGNLCRPFLICTKKVGVTYYVLCVIGFLLSLLYLPVCHILPEWFINKIPSPIYYLTPLFAIGGMVSISLFIERNFNRYIIVFLSTCGKFSLIILAFHQIVCMIAQQYVSSKAAILIMIISLVFLVWFIPKYIPWVLGKSKI